MLDAEDEGPATEVFTDCLPDVAAADPSWDREDVFIDVETLLECGRPAPLDDIGDWEPPIPAGAVLTPPELEPDDFDGPDAPDANWSRAARRGSPLRSADGSIEPDDDGPARPLDRHSPEALRAIRAALYGPAFDRFA